MQHQDHLQWNGIDRGYIPPEVLAVHPSLRLHQAAAPDIDPITYEVVRYSLASINMEHGETLRKLCISPITMLTQDFQPSILTEDGEYVFFGPYLQYFSNQASNSIQWTMEYRSEDPGIHPGDMFLCNDPYVGTTHQQDVVLMCPVFWEGALFCWVSNVIHHADVGGTTPGSFCVNARDIWDDPPPFPPIKLVEGGRLKTELEALFIRQSRVPANVAIDLRAQIAGNNVASERLRKLMQRYGVLTVKGVMRRINEASEKAFIDKLSLVPDGRWSERIYNECALGGDRGTYCYQTNITKHGTELFIDNEGTDPQAGAINLTYSGWMGTTLAAVTAMLCYDQMGATGGAFRHCKFRPVPGTLTCAEFPAAVSPAGVYTVEVSIAAATGALAKMLACSRPELRRKLLTVGEAQWPIAIFSGINQHGYYYVAPNLDTMCGALGASPERDGIDCGGHFWVPAARAGNVEEHEQLWPILYLYRRIEQGESFGAGMHRGGRGGVEATVPYGTARLSLDVYHHESVPKAPGLLGGYPGGLAHCRVMRRTDIAVRFAAGTVPQQLDDLTGEDVAVAFKGPPIVLEPDDVWEWNWPSASGYSDPLGRAPEQVIADVTGGDITRATAREVYCVAISDAGGVDAGETARLRAARRAARLSAATPPSHAAQAPATAPAIPELRISIGENLRLDRTAEAALFICAGCERVLGAASENYKTLCAMSEVPVRDIGAGFVDTAPYVDDVMVFRQFLCPGCGTLLDTEICRQGDALLHDIRIDGA